MLIYNGSRKNQNIVYSAAESYVGTFKRLEWFLLENNYQLQAV